MRPSGPGTTGRRQLLSKVPEVTVLFWVAKVLTTGMGETTSDFLANSLGPVVAVGIGGLGLLVALALQFRATRYVTAVYWFAIVMVSVFGTMAADGLHVVIGVPYVISAPLFLFSLVVVFAWWRISEGTLDIHSVRTVRRELFYWAAVLSTFAMGTAVGDLAASAGKLGYFEAGLVFTAAIAVPALAHWKLRMNPVLAFWLAYVLTRPLGASFADWLGAPKAHHGMGLGYGPVSAVLAVVIVLVVAVLWRVEHGRVKKV
ncbi:membrane protein [Kitasatospora viridis]